MTSPLPPGFRTARRQRSGSRRWAARPEALAAEHEAVAIRRELAAAMPDCYGPDLAAALARLAVICDELGQTIDADSLRTEAAQVADGTP
jgi:hypothetical protein